MLLVITIKDCGLLRILERNAFNHSKDLLSRKAWAASFYYKCGEGLKIFLTTSMARKFPDARWIKGLWPAQSVILLIYCV